MQKYNLPEFDNALLEIGIEVGDTLLIHSSLFSLGIPVGIPVREIPQSLFTSILKKVGPEGTIVAPSFTYNFCKGNPYDRQNTPSERMGEFSEFIRKHPESIRSKHPMESVVAIGKHAELITENDTIGSFTDNSPFDKLLQLDTKLILLGASLNSASIIHRAETKLAVPYRYWKTFSGDYTDNGITSNKMYDLYVRDLNKNPKLTLSHVWTGLEEKGKVRKIRVGSGNLASVLLKEFYQHVYEGISKNPFYLIESINS